jgi:hypothetical protein
LQASQDWIVRRVGSSVARERLRCTAASQRYLR